MRFMNLENYIQELEKAISRTNLSETELVTIFKDELGIYDSYTISLRAEFPKVIDDFVQFAPHRQFQKRVTGASMYGTHTILEAEARDGLIQFLPFILLDRKAGIAYEHPKPKIIQDTSPKRAKYGKEETRQRNQARYKEQFGKDPADYNCSVIFHGGLYKTQDAYYRNIAKDVLLFLRFIQERKLPAILIESYGWAHENQKRERIVVYDPK